MTAVMELAQTSSPGTPCAGCGGHVNRNGLTPRQSERKIYCATECRTLHRYQRHGVNAADRIEDIEFLLSWSYSHDEIARRLGISRKGVARWLHRHGRSDIARGFERVTER